MRLRVWDGLPLHLLRRGRCALTTPSPFEPDAFDRITARLPQLSAWQAAWNQAADDLNDTSIV
ncbi:hypothetical protein KBZ21_42285, partial [Streptomyces sp. A73]|nr:hypothetical protein [Streptomyces sp. A73]